LAGDSFLFMECRDRAQIDFAIRALSRSRSVQPGFTSSRIASVGDDKHGGRRTDQQRRRRRRRRTEMPAKTSAVLARCVPRHARLAVVNLQKVINVRWAAATTTTGRDTQRQRRRPRRLVSLGSPGQHGRAGCGRRSSSVKQGVDAGGSSQGGRQTTLTT